MRDTALTALFPLDFGEFLDVDNEVVSRVEFFGSPLEPHVPAFEVTAEVDAVLYPLVGLEIVGTAPLQCPVAGNVDSCRTPEPVLFFRDEDLGWR